MKNILTINQQTIDPHIPMTDTSNFKLRRAARAVLQDHNGYVYLLNVTKLGYHKLPGGGIDEGEKVIEALKRELLEEVGCECEVGEEIGEVIEYRDYDDGGLKQISYCYLANQVGDQVEANLEEGELAEGMVQIKAAGIKEAIELLENDRPDNLEGKFIQKRDIEILKKAQELLR